VETRVRKVLDGGYHAAVLARAGLERLGLTDVVTEWLPLEMMLPAPGQGALAVQCRADDEATLTLLAAIDDMHVRAAVTAERAFLAALGGGCSAPIAAHAAQVAENEVRMTALVAAPDGGQVIRVRGAAADAAALGHELARRASEQGGAAILDALHPLRGRRVVVTRARHQAQSMADKLQEVGATALLLPAIRIAPMPDMSPLAAAIRQLDTYDWVIFTSSNGVRVFCEQLNEMGRDASVLAEARIGVVGSATARALERRGVEPDFMPDEFVGEAVAAGLGDVSGQRILLPRAEIARKNLAELLAAAGAAVTDLPTYRTLPAELDERALAELRQGVDAVTFTSGSTARHFMDAIAGRVELADDVVVACIGPITAESARDLGLTVDVVADEYTTAGLVAALVEYFRQ
jgi:uroporphyrinogen-III synthase